MNYEIFSSDIIEIHVNNIKNNSDFSPFIGK